jgi:hypothetical protein
MASNRRVACREVIFRSKFRGLAAECARDGAIVAGESDGRRRPASDARWPTVMPIVAKW